MILERRDAQEIVDGLNMALSEAKAYGETIEMNNNGMYVETGTEEEKQRARQMNNMIADARVFEIPIEWDGVEWRIIG